VPDQLVSRPHPAWVIAAWVIAVIAARRVAEGGYGPWVMDLLVATIAERPDLAPLLRDFPGGWPDFMYEDPIASIYYGDAVRAYPEFVLVAIDRDDPSRALAKGYSVPFSAPVDALPDSGWDDVVMSATAERLAGRTGSIVSALEINIQVDHRGSGLSSVLLGAMRRNAARLGFDHLVAPVRPNGKHLHPETPMTGYIRWTRDDGLPVDPWLRVHVRAGGRIVRVAPRSMVIPGTLDEWRQWTGLAFDKTGPVHVPQALTPVHCDTEHDHAVYVEPNVWVHHPL
jgi:hypothetical protein